MMRRTLLIAAGLTVLGGQASAEIVAGDVYAALRETGAEVTVADRGTPEERILAIGYEFGRFVVSVDVVEGAVKLAPSATSDYDLQVDGLDGALLRIELEDPTGLNDGIEIDVRLDAEDFIYRLRGERSVIETAQSGAYSGEYDSKADGFTSRGTFTLEGIESASVLSREGGENRTRAVYDVSRLSSATTIPIGDGETIEQNQLIVQEDIAFEMRWSGLDLDAFDASSFLTPLRFDMTGSAGKSRTVTNDSQSGRIQQQTSAGSTISAGWDGANMAFDVASEENLFRVAGVGVPGGKLDVAVGRMALGGAMPIVPDGQTRAGRAELEFEGVLLGDGLWSTFDPTGVLPRDPMGLSIDVELDFSLAEDALRRSAGDDLLIVEGVRITEAQAYGLGASFDALGAFEIVDNGEETVPVGTLGLDLTGIDALLADLQNLGTVAPEQVFVMRMMLGSILIPDPDADAHRAEFEFGADGSVSANGVVLGQPKSNSR